MGLLDDFSSFAKSPEGVGLLSAAFGGMAAARRKQPWNTLGVAGLSGLTGYSNANEQAQQLEQGKQMQTLRDLQIGQAQRELDSNKAMGEALKALSQPQPAQPEQPYGGNYSPAVTSAFGLPDSTPAQPANPAPANQPSFADAVMAKAKETGNADLYNKAYAMKMEEKKLLPKFSTAPQVVKINGVPTPIQMADDGSWHPMGQGVMPAEKLHFEDSGQLAGIGLDPYTGQAVTQGIQKQQTPDSIASNSIARQRMGYEFGTTPDGQAGIKVLAEGIANGTLPAPTGMALSNPRMVKALEMVRQINPNYDFTDVTAKKKAASDFTSGALGNQMRANFTGRDHLEQLSGLVDAMANGNTQIINKIGNAYKTQTGNPAPTNFEAAKNVVSAEVMKSIVANGGGVTEREELAKSMSQAQSPAQLKGVIETYKNLMDANYNNLLEQRRAAGLSDSTMPKYGERKEGIAAQSVSLADIAATAKSSGKSTAEVTAALKAKGYTIQGGQ